MLPVGSLAPNVEGTDHHGERVRLFEPTPRLCTVLFFFPKAFTPICTREAASFRDNFPELLLAGARLLGVSTDDSETQARFACSLASPFPMIADSDGSIARLYDVQWPLIGLAKRVTYIIGSERRILHVLHHEFSVRAHRDDVLRLVDRLFCERRAPRTTP